VLAMADSLGLGIAQAQLRACVARQDTGGSGQEFR
jgi:hypothetical protein